ncbi:MAG: T9SS type A sorting domain-containing protein, partial [Verrucomicrobia bacterium]|nr:T9SS type A sorting domain-containing protein [Cytophagales bacterium]
FEAIPSNNIVRFGTISAEVISVNVDTNVNTLEVKVPAGFYQAKISVSTSVGTTTSDKDFTMLVTATENSFEHQIKVYPNPTQGKLVIDFGEKAIMVEQISVLNSMGSRIVEKTIQKVIQSQEIDLSGRSSGIYLLLIKTETGLISKKIILK